MNRAIHLNLLRTEERVSSSRVRLHVMAPILSALAVAGVLLWWAWLLMQTWIAQAQLRSADEAIAGMQGSHKRATETTEQEAELKKQLAQLELYRHGAVRYGAFLRKLAEQMPPTIQLTQLELLEPPAQAIGAANPRAKKGPSFGPDQPDEAVRLRLTGRTPDAASVDRLLEVLRLPVFREMVESATVPKGAFRQEQGSEAGRNRVDDGREYYRFDVECALKQRVFE